MALNGTQIGPSPVPRHHTSVSSPADDVWALVLAAGSGTRFGTANQFEDVAGTRLVDLAVAAASPACDHCVVVLPDGTAWDGPPVTEAVTGGATRADSVRAGLEAVPADAAIVVIHDAAHPLAPAALFEAVIARVRDGFDAAVPVAPLRDTVMRVQDGEVTAAVPRNGLTAVQMPHAFSAQALRAAHATGVEAPDDASLVLATGGRIAAVPGDPINVHVTTKEELLLARRLLVGAPEPGTG